MSLPMQTVWRSLFACTLLLACSGFVRGAEPQVELRVMTFNVRYGTAKDGPNAWNLRRDRLVDTVRAFDPDLLGTQETLGFQRDYLAEKLGSYDVIGVGRVDGREDGEMMALYYKRDRFKKLDGGHFWLSETPEVVGSKSWDSSLPRMTTWVKLVDRRLPDARPLTIFNTHFDHQGPQARLESARLLRRKTQELGRGSSLLVTGDFNADQDSPPYLALFARNDDLDSPLVDIFRIVRPDRSPDEGTFSGFRADATRGPRIDWIGASRDWKVLAADIDRTAFEGRTPSDHFPVTARLARP